jgi:hypothetical protein
MYKKYDGNRGQKYVISLAQRSQTKAYPGYSELLYEVSVDCRRIVEEMGYEYDSWYCPALLQDQKDWAIRQEKAAKGSITLCCST